MYKSIELIRNFFIPAGSKLPEQSDQYYLNIMKQYENTCGDLLGFGQDENGDVFFDNEEAEARFARSLESFLQSYLKMNEEFPMESSLLHLYYEKFLENGRNCPAGSPAWQRIDLAERFSSLKAELEKELEREVDLSWDDILKEMKTREGLTDDKIAETGPTRQKLLGDAIKMIEGIKSFLFKKNVLPSNLSALQIVFELLSDKKKKEIGLMLIGMLEQNQGSLNFPPRFHELAEVVRTCKSKESIVNAITILKDKEKVGLIKKDELLNYLLTLLKNSRNIPSPSLPTSFDKTQSSASDATVKSPIARIALVKKGPCNYCLPIFYSTPPAGGCFNQPWLTTMFFQPVNFNVYKII